MISLLLSLVLGFLAILCLVLKMTGLRFSKSWDITICIVIPIICILTFLSLIVEASIRRTVNSKELEYLLTVVEKSMSSNRVFTTNDEKKLCLDSLEFYAERVETIAFNDSLISLVAGHDTCMQRRIVQANNAVSQSIKWISRINNIYKDEISFSQKELDDIDIKLIGPGLYTTSVLNVAIKVNEQKEHPICTYVQVLSSDSVLYAKAFEYIQGINCFNIPTFNSDYVIIEIGYIYQSNDINIFKYITYVK